MTDAAMAVTERAVERFTERYLTALGADIEKDGRRWTVSIPDEADTDLELDGAVLEITTNPAAVGDDARAIAPESDFVERLLDEAAGRTPTGSVALTADDVDLRLPEWLTSGAVEIDEVSFTPYYDRRALCALFHVGIETVSEYQREQLHAVAIDLADNEARPRLADTYLELTGIDGPDTLSAGTEFEKEELTEGLDAARSEVENAITPAVRETRERATRAAEVELDEYREFATQRREELEKEIDRLNERIEETTATIDSAVEQSDRVEALRTRKNLRAELEEVRSGRDELISQIEADFPEKRAEVRERHAITVRIRPVVATAASYERGDIDISIRRGREETSVTYGYAVGAGVMDDPTCEGCGRALSDDNPLTLNGTTAIGDACCGGR